MSGLRVFRFRASDVRQLPIAGARCGKGTLIQFLGQRALLEAGHEFVAARFRDGIAFLVNAVRPDVFYVGGGLTERADLRACFIDAFSTLPVVWSRGGRFVGESGGRSIAGESAIVFDIGQTAIKVSHADSRRIHNRPPPEFGADGCDIAGLSFIRSVLASELNAAAAGAAVVLAVPGDVSDDLTPGLSSYRWPRRPGLIRELIPSGCERNVLVLNDAELAAESARVEVSPSQGQLCLVLTLGRAPGGALLTRSQSAATG